MKPSIRLRSDALFSNVMKSALDSKDLCFCRVMTISLDRSVLIHGSTTMKMVLMIELVWGALINPASFLMHVND